MLLLHIIQKFIRKHVGEVCNDNPFKTSYTYIGPSESQRERRARSPLVEVPVLNEDLNLIDEIEGISEGYGYEIQNCSDLKRKRTEERNDDDDRNKDVDSNTTPKKKTSIQEKLKAFEAPSPTPTQKFKFRKLN